MPFQTVVNDALALGVPGKIATGNPYSVLPQVTEGAQVAGTGGVYAGRFGWVQPDGTVLNTDGGSGKTPDGYIINELSGSLELGEEASLLIQEGRPVTLLTRGDVFFQLPQGAAAVSVGDAIKCNANTGEVDQTAAVATQFVVSGNSVDGIGIMSA